jgi:hypothetical protein
LNSIDVLQKWHENPEMASSPPTLACTPRLPEHEIWLGDFNRQNPLWEEERNHHSFMTEALDMAQPPLNLLAEYRMGMVLPKGIPTHEQASTKNWTRPDNVFASPAALKSFIKCDVDPSHTDRHWQTTCL